MRFIVQPCKEGKDAPVQTGVYIELNVEQDLPKLFGTGYISMQIADTEGKPIQQICVYLKGRGIVAEKLVMDKQGD